MIALAHLSLSECGDILHNVYVGKSFNTLEAAVRRCSVKKMFLKILQYLQENTFVGVSFNKIAGLADLLKRDFNTGVFMFIVFLCSRVFLCLL